MSDALKGLKILSDAALVQESIRTIYCSNKTCFVAIFGPEAGEHLYLKLTDELQRDCTRFICELDGKNMHALTAYVKRDMVDPSVLGSIMDLGLGED